MGSHEIDDFRSDFFRRTHKITFIFTVLVIYNDDDITVFYRLNGIFNGIQGVIFHKLGVKKKV